MVSGALSFSHLLDRAIWELELERKLGTNALSALDRGVPVEGGKSFDDGETKPCAVRVGVLRIVQHLFEQVLVRPRCSSGINITVSSSMRQVSSPARIWRSR